MLNTKKCVESSRNTDFCMMKKLFLIRHAKSSWDDAGLRDFERPLAQRGKRDAPFMANILLNMSVQPDKLVSSPAQRAQDTAVHFAKILHVDPWNIQLIESIYEALPDTLHEVVTSLDNQWQTVLLFGHNPGFTLYANRFSEGSRFDNVPTCGIVCIESDTENWIDFVPGNAKIKEWFFPKSFAI
jgi:phosphohistidine phosphatase